MNIPFVSNGYNPKNNLSPPFPNHYTKQELEEGHKEAVKETIKEGEMANQKLNDLVERCDIILYKLSSVFPFEFFPDKLIIDINKVTIFVNHFFFSGEIHTVLIKNIRDIHVESSIFFATLKMTVFDYKVDSVVIERLQKHQALKARRIIQGLMALHKENIDLSQIKNEDGLAEKIEHLGRAGDA